MSGICERKSFKDYFLNCPEDAVDLLDKILVLDPDRRQFINFKYLFKRFLEYPLKKLYIIPTCWIIQCLRMSQLLNNPLILMTMIHQKMFRIGKVNLFEFLSKKKF